MGRGTFKIETVSWFEEIVLAVMQPNFELAAHDVEKLFAFVGIRFATAAADSRPDARST